MQLDLAFWAPRWAVKRRSPQPTRQRFIPNAQDFAAFAKAIAKRYSGHFSDPRHHIGRLPAVHLYTTWNEPNFATFLAPQWVRKKKGYRPYSPHVYRDMHEAAYAAIKSVSPDNRVLIGGLSSIGGERPGRGGVPPLEFTRTLACVNRKLRPLKVPECRGAGKLHADGFAIHPYSVDVAPGVHAPRGDDVFLADLSRLDTLLGELYKRGRTDHDWPVYVTEYGYETKPPDPTAQYTPEQQARYVGWSTFLAQSDPRVKMFAQFLLRDVAPHAFTNSEFNDYQTGLLYPDGDAQARGAGVQDPAVRVLRHRARRVPGPGALRRRAAGRREARGARRVPRAPGAATGPRCRRRASRATRHAPSSSPTPTASSAARRPGRDRATTGWAGSTAAGTSTGRSSPSTPSRCWRSRRRRRRRSSAAARRRASRGRSPRPPGAPPRSRPRTRAPRRR